MDSDVLASVLGHPTQGQWLNPVRATGMEAYEQTYSYTYDPGYVFFSFFTACRSETIQRVYATFYSSGGGSERMALYEEATPDVGGWDIVDWYSNDTYRSGDLTLLTQTADGDLSDAIGAANGYNYGVVVDFEDPVMLVQGQRYALAVWDPDYQMQFISEATSTAYDGGFWDPYGGYLDDPSYAPPPRQAHSYDAYEALPATVPGEWATEGGLYAYEAYGGPIVACLLPALPPPPP